MSVSKQPWEISKVRDSDTCSMFHTEYDRRWTCKSKSTENKDKDRVKGARVTADDGMQRLAVHAGTRAQVPACEGA